jgi:RNA polymerase sigma-70 factor (ECF subfamily)
MGVQTDPGEIGVLPVDRALDGSDDPARRAPAEFTEAGRVASFRACLATEDAFRRFYDAALPRVYGYLLHRCRGNTALAEDLTQTAFGEAIRRRDAYDGRSDPVTWLIGIARHKLLDQFRADERDEHRRMRLVVRELVLDREAGEWRDVDERASLITALGRLTSMQRAVLILHYADGLPVTEIAREIGRSLSATESLMTRARAALRDAYEEASDD